MQVDQKFSVLDGHPPRDGQTSRRSTTVGVTEQNVTVDLGVLEAQAGMVSTFGEKPNIRLKVSMGIYCMEPRILELIPKGSPFVLDDLMKKMPQQKLSIHVFEHHGLWWEIGQEEDFRYAQRVFVKDHKSAVLGCQHQNSNDTSRAPSRKSIPCIPPPKSAQQKTRFFPNCF